MGGEEAEARMRRQLPPWAMGLAVAPLGFYFGFVSTATPILLAARGVSVEEIFGQRVGAHVYFHPRVALKPLPKIRIRFKQILF